MGEILHRHDLQTGSLFFFPLNDNKIESSQNPTPTGVGPPEIQPEPPRARVCGQPPQWSTKQPPTRWGQAAAGALQPSPFLGWASLAPPAPPPHGAAAPAQTILGAPLDSLCACLSSTGALNWMQQSRRSPTWNGTQHAGYIKMGLVHCSVNKRIYQKPFVVLFFLW